MNTHVIPFNVTIPEQEQDPELREKLKAELPGILAWEVRGYPQGLPGAAVRATSHPTSRRPRHSTQRGATAALLAIWERRIAGRRVARAVGHRALLLVVTLAGRG